MRQGFSLIEMLVVIAILVVVALVTIPNLFGGSREADLVSVTRQMVASAREVQSDSAQNVQGSQYGIYFSNATNARPFYAIFKGSSYASGTVLGTYPLPATIGYVTSTLAAGAVDDIIFDPISGGATPSATIELYAIAEPSLNSTIEIGALGEIIATLPTTLSQPASSTNVWVVDSMTHRIGEFNATGAYLSQFGSAQLLKPWGIAIDHNGNFWIADSWNDSIDEFSATGTYLSKFGSYGTGNGQFDDPREIAIDANGNFWITEHNNDRVQEFSATGTYLSKFGSYGTGNGQFHSPEGIAIDHNGNLWVADTGNGRMEEFSATGTYLSQFGPSPDWEFWAGDEPTEIAIDANNNIWLADGDNRSIDEYNNAGAYLGHFGSQGEGDGQFEDPSNIAIDAAGNFWVTDYYSRWARVEEFSATGTYLSQFGSYGAGDGQFEEPNGIVVH